MFDFRNIYSIPEPDEPALAAAMEIARRAHPSELRRKPAEGQQVKYISHPVLSYRLLRTQGVNDEITLMAALLHDALEPVSDEAHRGPYVDNPERLDHDLQIALRRQRIPHAASVAHKVVRLIYLELTITDHIRQREAKNGQFDKKAYQLAVMQTSSDAARLIKMADHASTLLCDLLIAPDDTMERRQMLVDRIHEVAKTCVAQFDSNSRDGVAANKFYALIEWLARETRSVMETGLDSEGKSLSHLHEKIFEKLQPMSPVYDILSPTHEISAIFSHGTFLENEKGALKK